MEVKYQDLGLKDGYLYEILATSISFKNDKLIPNTSCMGIRTLNDKIIIRPYDNTKTYTNLINNHVISINFVENIYLYALAALKGSYLSNKFLTFPKEYYNYYDLKNNIGLKTPRINQIPYLKDAWAILFCRTEKSVKIDKEDVLGTVSLSEFELNLISMIKIKDSFKYFNRAENLTLEALILTTRLNIAIEKNNYDLAIDFKNKINDTIKTINQFSKNLEVTKSISLIKDYIQNLRLKF